MGKYKTAPQGKRYVADVFSTFDDPQRAANVGIEQGWVELEEKGLLGTHSGIGNGGKFLSITYGEYAIVRAGFATVILALTDHQDGVEAGRLARQTAEIIIQQTNGYYNDPIKNKPKDTVWKTVNQIIKELKQNEFLDQRNGKYYWSNVDSVDLVAAMYGTRLNHSTGLSSFSRMMLVSMIGIEEGIGEDYVTECLTRIHGVDSLNPDHIRKVKFVHGINGTGYILQSVGGRLYRVYSRLDQPLGGGESVLEERPDVLNAILTIPCISEDIVYELFGLEVKERLRDETSTLRPNLATALVVRRGENYFPKGFVDILNLRNCQPEENPMLALITELYRKFTPADAPVVAQRARNVAHTLHSDGEIKPRSEVQRRIMTFLAGREIVEVDPHRPDVFLNKNTRAIKNLSVMLGNVLECGQYKRALRSTAG